MVVMAFGVYCSVRTKWKPNCRDPKVVMAMSKIKYPLISRSLEPAIFAVG